MILDSANTNYFEITQFYSSLFSSNLRYLNRNVFFTQIISPNIFSSIYAIYILIQFKTYFKLVLSDFFEKLTYN